MQLGYNIDKHYCARCIKAGYYKMGCGNLLYHPNDGYTAPCVIEFDLEDSKDFEKSEDIEIETNSSII